MAAPATSPQRLLQADDRHDRRCAVVDSGLVTVEMCPAGFGLMLNVSQHGIGVYTLKNLEPSQQVQISFLVPGSTQIVECNGSVVWAADSHAGLRLSQFREASATALGKWLRNLPQVAGEENPRLQRRSFPIRDEQVRAIEAHIASEALRLDRALQLIVTRFLELTGANGGAIALGEPPTMVCRASAGLAPEIGVPIASNSGLTGECIRTGKSIYCEDTELDSRVDREACRELNLRSSLIVPVLHEHRVEGVLEVFSASPAAFQGDHRWLMNRLAEVTASLAWPPLSGKREEKKPPQNDPRVEPVPKFSATGVAKFAPAKPSATEFLNLEHGHPWARLFRAKYFWVAVLLVTSLVGLWFAVRNRSRSMPPQRPAAAQGKINAPATNVLTPSDDSRSVALSNTDTLPKKEHANNDDSPSLKAHAARASSASQPSVMVLPRGDSTSIDPEVPMQSAPAVELSSRANLQELSLPLTATTPELEHAATITGGALIHRVDPSYPSLALRLHIEGDVVFRAHIGKQGTVTAIHELKGDPRLSPAAKAAVRQWRYEPLLRNNVPQETDTTITLQFRIPQR